MSAGYRLGIGSDSDLCWPACAYAGLAAGADGVHIEVHDHPEEAFSDGPQALSPEEFATTFKKLKELARIFGGTF